MGAISTLWATQTPTNGVVPISDGSGSPGESLNAWVTDGSGSAPADAKYIIQTVNASLPNAQILSVLATGLLKNTTGTGILSIGVSATDYVAPGIVTTSGLTMATARLLGRGTASSGAIEEITVGSGLNLSVAGVLTSTGGTGTVTHTGALTVNQVVVGNGTDDVKILAASTNGFVLTLVAGVPAWAVGSASTPGGSTTQLQYNNAGAFGGISNVTTNGTYLQFGATAIIGPAASAGNLIAGTATGDLCITNTSSKEISLSLDGGTTRHIQLTAGSFVFKSQTSTTVNLFLNSTTATNNSLINFQLAGSGKLVVGSVGTAGQIITGSGANDAVFSSAANVLFSCDAGATRHVYFTPGAYVFSSQASTVANIFLNCATSTSNSVANFQLGGVGKLVIGAVGTANQQITGTVQNDGVIVATGNLLLSADGGATAAAKIVVTTGQVQFLKNITSTSTTTGTLVVTGGLGVSGAVFTGSGITTGAPSGGTAAAWKFGSLVTAAVVPDTTRYVELDVGGTLFKMIVGT